MKKIIAIFMALVFMFSVIGVAYAAESIEIEEPTTTLRFQPMNVIGLNT